ncbi:MAG TPA: hypothetical protein VIW29_11225 [Polyangiaceae bacterium]
MRWRKSRFKAALALALGGSALLLAGGAAAQPADSEQRYGYRFEDDYMVGDTLASTPPLLRVRPRVLKVNLLRPRASFVAEMLKSVETM